LLPAASLLCLVPTPKPNRFGYVPFGYGTLFRRNLVSCLPRLPAGCVPGLDLVFGRIGVPRPAPHTEGLQPRKSCLKTSTGGKKTSVRFSAEVRCLITGDVTEVRPREPIRRPFTPRPQLRELR
jgi:hypothetical protein